MIIFFQDICGKAARHRTLYFYNGVIRIDVSDHGEKIPLISI